MNSTATLPRPPEPAGTATAVLGDGTGGRSGAGGTGLAGTAGAAPLLAATGVGAGASGGKMGDGGVPCSSRRQGVGVSSRVVHIASTGNTTTANSGHRWQPPRAMLSCAGTHRATRVRIVSLLGLRIPRYEQLEPYCWLLELLPPLRARHLDRGCVLYIPTRNEAAAGRRGTYV